MMSSQCVCKLVHVFVEVFQFLFHVQREVQAHFSCSDVIGGELESQKPTGSADSFWEKRVFGVSCLL